MPMLVALNGKVYTMDPNRPTAEAVVVRDNRIVYVGSTREARAKATDEALIIDLESRSVMPGFNDAHVHPLAYGSSLTSVNCTSPPNQTIGDLLDNVREWVDKTPEGQWIKGWGYDDTKLLEKRHPTRDDLDRVAPHHPVYLRRACGHLGVANSLALQLASIDETTTNPRGGHIDRDATGRPTGVLRETAQELVARLIPQMTREDMREVLRLVGSEFARRGVTSCWDAGVGRDSTEILAAYYDLQREGDFPVRVNLAIAGALLDELEALQLPFQFGDDWLRITAVKLILDGSVSGHTAALHEPFAGTDDTGILYMPQDELNQLVRRVHQLGLQVGIHAIGDRAVDSAIDAIAHAQASAGTVLRPDYLLGDEPGFSGVSAVYREGPRHRIEHCSLTAPDRVERLSKLGVLPVPQPIFMYGEGDSYLEYLGSDRVSRAYTMRSFLDAGIPVPMSSDSPATSWDDPLSPFLGVAMAVTRTTETGQSMDATQTIDVGEALRAYTLHSAFASFDEHRKGSLAVGKLADFIVLDRDPFSIPYTELGSIRVMMTIMDGEIVYQAG